MLILHLPNVFDQAAKFPHAVDKVPPPPSPVQGGVPSTVGGYDVDHEYASIMTKALNSYKDHRERERVLNEEQELMLAHEYTRPTQMYNFPKRPLSSRARCQSAKLNRGVRPLGQLRNSSSLESEQSEGTVHWISAIPKVPQRPTHKFANLRVQSARPTRPDSSVSRMSLPNMTDLRHYKNKTWKHINSHGAGVFTPCGSRREYYTIHPDWVSENLSVQKLSLSNRQSGKDTVDAATRFKSSSLPTRRCKSAPPPRSRNIITWETRH
ncbi:uncharacterized protein LOC106150424 isoform X2 [Lingula anatina]|uniref:Uncharacterized protein LOC106150424 isoform X2 n=1 Tax=Lingula anatina TaxID=7574 RepID=A0A1S3GXT4_LINAN|nr:uncharacterized protein LOC106150424 isoform X2 [Lingula anatina]|eukprot:XP_013378675.1 uncharacterized protein LOC106150424 isoform X2 [Lingula anatina]